jgi:hypothetical protein
MWHSMTLCKSYSKITKIQGDNYMNGALEKAVTKIYEQIAETGKVTDNQLILIALYEKRNKPSPISDVLKDGTKVISTIDKIMGGVK